MIVSRRWWLLVFVVMGTGVFAGGGCGGGDKVGTGGTAGGTAGTGGGTGGSSGSGAGGMGGAGGTACRETFPPDSLAASCASCIAEYAAPTDGCCNLAATDAIGFMVCQQASACMRAGGAPVGQCNVAGDTSPCYCGTNVSTCDGGDPPANGPCVAQMTAAAGRNVVTMITDSPTPSQVVERFGDTDYALGRASSIHSFAGAFCGVECGF